MGRATARASGVKVGARVVAQPKVNVRAKV